MPEYPSKEALAAYVAGDAGFREFLTILPEAERDTIGRVLESPALLETLLAILPPDQQSATQSLLDSIFSVPDEALNLYNQCRFLEARDLLARTMELYEIPDGMPADGIVKAAGFVVQRVKALCHVLLGDVEQTLGNTALAGEHHHRALLLAKECGDRDTEGRALYGLGCYYWELGDYEQALEHSTLARDLLVDGADRWSSLGKALNTLSLIHAELGCWDQALEYGEQAVALALERQDMKILPVILCNRSVQLTAQGRLDEVEPLLEQALAIACEQGDLRQQALIRRNLGMSHLNCAVDGGVEIALNQFREALEISSRIGAPGLEALAYRGIGYVLIMKDDIDGAEEQFRLAVDRHRAIGAVADCAEALVELGNLLRYRRNLPEAALACYVEAIGKTEQVRAKLKRETHRIGLSEVRIEPYQQVITTLLHLGRTDEAFHNLERSRSKALLELLTGQFDGDAEEGSFRDAAQLAMRIEELRRTLEEIVRADETGAEAATEEDKRRETMRNKVQQGLDEEERRFARLCEELRHVAPERVGMVGMQATDSISVRALLPPGTALVELYQTDDCLFIFVLRPEHSVQVVTVELSADEAAEIIFPFINALRDPIALDARSHAYLRNVRQPASWLHQAIFCPLDEFLDGVQRLVIVPHLFWHYLPFHALFDGERREYLMDRFEISYAPSASVLEVCLGKKRHGRDRALVLCRDDGDLPHVEKEGDLIGKVFSTATILQGGDATLDQASGHLSPDVIHCACHGYFNPDQPFLSGIAIPPGKGEDRPTFMMDLMRLRLDSSLVTLSACDTGLSRISNADDLVGLSRAFFGAGAAALLLSLWKVADSSTAYLMENFYWHYVANRQSKGRSLQLAMQAVRANPDYAHPYYWAPFVVMGEWA